MIVEFLGVPGSGKTTIAQRVVTELQKKSLQANLVHLTGYERLDGTHMNRMARQVDRIAAISTQPLFGAQMLQCLIREGRGPALSWVINLARRSYGMRRLPKGGCEVTVLGEGPLSAICLAACAMRASWSIERVLRHVRLPDVAVLLVVPGDVAFQRVLERTEGVGRLNASYSPTWTDEYMNVAEEVTHNIPVPVIRAETGHTGPTEVTNIVVESIFD